MFYSVFHGIITELLTRGYNITCDCLKKNLHNSQESVYPLKETRNLDRLDLLL